jgi:serine/threonine-protein kinase
MGESGQPLRLVHRDIKPSNLMLNTQGVSKLLDFGISYAHGADEARGSVKGTWGYMAPEQSTGEPVGPAADLFGLAAVLYEVASREPLFPETDTAVVGRLLVADEAARRAAGLGGAYLDLAGVLVRALQRDPDARFPSAEAMGRALGALVPDPLSARDGLVRLVTELRRYDAGPSPMADGRNEGAADGAQGGQRRSSSSQASNASAASVASQSTLNPGSGGTGRGRSGRVSSLADGEAAGLPVAVGGAHSARRSTVGRRPRSASPSMNTVLSLGFAVLAVAVLAFTAWRLYLGPRTQPAPRPDAAEEFPGEPSGEGWAASVHDAVAPESEAASGMQPSPASSDVPPTTSSTSSGSVATRAPANAPAQAGANPPGALSSSRRPPTRAVADGPAPTPASLVADLAPSSEEGAARGSPSSPGSASGTPIAVPPGATPASASNLPGTSSASSPSRGAASDARAGEGSLSLGSTPRAQVMIDGAYVRYTPIFQHNLPAGSHTVIFVTDDGRRKSFRVDIGEGVEARKVWLFDENRWADGASAEP